MSHLITCFTTNWGRGYDPGELKRNVLAVLDKAGDHAVLGVQELDEADGADEHAILRAQLDKGTTLVGWKTREPLIVSPGLETRMSRIVVGCQGLPKVTPLRHIVGTVTSKDGQGSVAVLNQHPPINRISTQSRRAQMRRVHRAMVDRYYSAGLPVIWMGDMNDAHYMKIHPMEETVYHDGLDWIRMVPQRHGTQLEVLTHGTIGMTIDGHDAGWVRFRVS
jgi:endonuclease/exonuclease/phosphatase family metal-dependent hydrolase